MIRPENLAMRPRPPADPVAQLRKETSYKNSWARKKVDDSSQVEWKSEFASKPRVAIIGGGMAGLSCARELALNGIESVVFDSGRRGVGGRCATRKSEDGSLALAKNNESKMIFDHACQFITDNGDLRFRALISEWLQEGLVRPWTAPLAKVKLHSEGRKIAMIAEAQGGSTRYIAPKGFRSLAEGLESRLDKAVVSIQRPFWIAKMKAGEKGWLLYNKRGDLGGGGPFDFIVISHNGKCANSLLGTAGTPKMTRQVMKLRLSSSWVLMVQFREPFIEASSFEGLQVEGCPVLSWAGNNSAKMNGPSSGPPCWTLISTNEYAQGNKVPQEALNKEIEDKISQEMLEAFARSIGASQLPPVLFFKCQLWGAALPLNSPQVDCIFDQDSRAAVVGDWLLGSSAPCAAVSGIEGARRIIRMARGEKGLDLGLDAQFKPLPSLPVPLLSMV